MPWLCGLDLGQAADPTALVAIEQTPTLTPAGDLDRSRMQYAVRHIERFPLGVPYPKMVEMVGSTVSRPPLSGCRLATDFTGVGRPVMDILRAARLPVKLRPILITAGHAVSFNKDDGAWHVPKKELVSTLQVLLQEGRLKIAGRMPLTPVLTKEFENFKVKVTAAANETFGVWRDGQHDDIVLAVALACWLGENEGGGDLDGISLPAKGERSVWEKAPEGVFNS